MTDENLERALQLTAELSRVMTKIINPHDPVSDADWQEWTMRIHSVQDMICRQIASTVYPEVRPLGKSFQNPDIFDCRTCRQAYPKIGDECFECGYRPSDNPANISYLPPEMRNRCRTQ